MKIFKILTVVFFATSVFATSVINFSLEPMKATKGSYIHSKDKRVSWQFGGEYGWMLNQHFVLGPAVNFSWYLEKDKVTIPNTQNPSDANTSLVNSKERIIAIPIAVFAIVDPIPQFMFHPVLHGQIGYNSVFVSNVDYNKDLPQENKDNVKKYDGYYNGIYTKFGVDCMIDVGEQISLFAGPQWQISTVERRKKDTAPYERKFNAFGLRLGVSFLL